MGFSVYSLMFTQQAVIRSNLPFYTPLPPISFSVANYHYPTFRLTLISFYLREKT